MLLTPDIWAAEDRVLMFVFEGNAIYINASMFGRIIRDPASPPEEVSIKEQNESLQTAFPNNVLISKFNDECGWSKQSPREQRKRGAESEELISI